MMATEPHSERVTVAWECAACGHRHLWNWDRWDAENNDHGISMYCGLCLTPSERTGIVRIGARVYAAIYTG
jgi:hypothetical protein